MTYLEQAQRALEDAESEHTRTLPPLPRLVKFIRALTYAVLLSIASGETRLTS